MHESAAVYLVGGSSDLPLVSRLLRERYGRQVRRSPHPHAATAIGLARRLSPRPLRGYFVDVPPETAYARKAEQYSLDDLTRQAELYREESARLGVHKIDGERPREDLCAKIAEDVWRAL